MAGSLVFNVALFEPEIAPNTGNIVRLCANTGCRLHLLGKLGFDWDDKKLRRAGLDYREWADVSFWGDFDEFSANLSKDGRIYAFTTKAQNSSHSASFRRGDCLLFGPETRGLPGAILDSLVPERKLRLPMVEGSRSLNLSNSVAVAVYEAWRQNDFAGAASLPPAAKS